SPWLQDPLRIHHQRICGHPLQVWVCLERFEALPEAEPSQDVVSIESNNVVTRTGGECHVVCGGGTTGALVSEEFRANVGIFPAEGAGNIPAIVSGTVVNDNDLHEKFGSSNLPIDGAKRGSDILRLIIQSSENTDSRASGNQISRVHMAP